MSSPDLVVIGTNAGWTINGKAEVPRADIVLRELPDEAVILSPDVIARSCRYRYKRWLDD